MATALPSRKAKCPRKAGIEEHPGGVVGVEPACQGKALIVPEERPLNTGLHPMETALCFCRNTRHLLLGRIVRVFYFRSSSCPERAVAPYPR